MSLTTFDIYTFDKVSVFQVEKYAGIQVLPVIKSPQSPVRLSLQYFLLLFCITNIMMTKLIMPLLTVIYIWYWWVLL